MCRFLCIICVLAILLSACTVSEPFDTETTGVYTQGIYSLSFQADQISNHSVGNDWSFSYTYNDEPIKNGHLIAFPLAVFSFISIGVTVTEEDKISDVGTGALRIGLCDGGCGKTEITVTENAGAFKGNTAVWEISCTVKLVGKQ